jgi:hypothetical protein
MTSEFVELLQKKSDDTEHFGFGLDEVRVVSKNEIEVKNNLFTVTDNGLDSFLEVLDIPKPYARRCPEEFLADTMNFWLKEKKNDSYAALAENGAIRNFVNPNYPYIPFAAVWGEVEDALGGAFEIGNQFIGEDFISVVALGREYEANVVDSLVRGGVQFSYADSWSTFPEVDTYLNRLVCMNGMTHRVQDNMKFRVSGKSYSEIFGTMRVFLNKAVDNIHGMIEGLEALNSDDVTNIKAVVKRICEENGLPMKIYNALMEAASSREYLSTIDGEKISTMHDIINLVTFVGSHNHEIGTDHRQHLLNIGGTAAVHHASRCSSCGSTV